MNKSTISRIFCATGLFFVTCLAQADPRIEVVWSCTLNEGKTLEDLHEVNGNWLEWNEEKGLKGITSHVANRILGGDLTDVLLIDSYPDWETYAALVAEYDSPDGEALDAAYNEVATCNSNTVWAVEASGD